VLYVGPGYRPILRCVFYRLTYISMIRAVEINTVTL